MYVPLSSERERDGGWRSVCRRQSSASRREVHVHMASCGNNKGCWQQRLFGKQLVCCGLDSSKLYEVSAATVAQDEGRLGCSVIGVYFSFINQGATCDDFTRQLVDLYRCVNAAERKRSFEVVHVVLWSSADVNDLEEGFRQHVLELPWLAVPNQDFERKVGRYS